MANGFILRSLPFTTSAFVALEAGSLAANVANDFMGMVALSPASPPRILIRVDLGAPLPVDTVACLNIIADTTGNGVRVTASNDPTFAVFEVVGNFTPPASEARTTAGFRHAVGFVTPSTDYRYYLFDLNGNIDSVIPQVARILIGTRFQPVRNFEWGLQRGAKDLGELQFAGRGALLRRRGRILRTLQISWPMLSDTEAEAGLAPLIEAAGNQEFLLVHQNPDADPQRSRRTWFGPVQGDPSIAWRHTNGHEHRLQLLSVI